jgi:hypothetical protein
VLYKNLVQVRRNALKNGQKVVRSRLFARTPKLRASGAPNGLPNLWGILPNHQAHTEASHVRSTCADSASREHLPRPPNTPPPTCNTQCVLTSWSPGTIDGANRNYVERTYWQGQVPEREVQ